MDADSLIGPIMQPIAKLFDFYTRNKDALEMADKARLRTLSGADIRQFQIDKQRKSNIFDPENLLQALNLQPEEATTPQSLMDKLLEPIVGPLKREFSNTKVRAVAFGTCDCHYFRKLMIGCLTVYCPTRTVTTYDGPLCPRRTLR